jgi:hypothetical protein
MPAARGAGPSAGSRPRWTDTTSMSARGCPAMPEPGDCERTSRAMKRNSPRPRGA